MVGNALTGSSASRPRGGSPPSPALWPLSAASRSAAGQAVRGLQLAPLQTHLGGPGEPTPTFRCCLRAVMALFRFCRAGGRGLSQGLQAWSTPTPLQAPWPGQGLWLRDQRSLGAPEAMMGSLGLTGPRPCSGTRRVVCDTLPRWHMVLGGRRLGERSPQGQLGAGQPVR